MATSNQAAINAARQRLGNQNMGYGDQSDRRTSQALQQATGRQPTNQEIIRYRTGVIDTLSQASRARQQPAQNRSSGSSGSSGGSSRGRSGGGSGGGGGVALGGINQARMDQLSAMLRGAKPGQAVANNIDLPDYQAPERRAFDSSTFDNFGNQWQAAYQQDAATQAKAGEDLLSFLASNYSNAYTNGNNTYATAGQAPGQSIGQLQQLLQGQGVDPSILAAEYGQRAGADQAFGNMWRSNAAASDTQHQGNLARANTDIANWAAGLSAQRRGGEAQIGLAKGQAQSRYNEQTDAWAREDSQLQQQIAMQEAMANWERGNQVSDTNLTNSNSYRNSMLEALLGLVPSLPANVALPDIAGWV